MPSHSFGLCSWEFGSVGECQWLTMHLFMTPRLHFRFKLKIKKKLWWLDIIHACTVCIAHRGEREYFLWTNKRRRRRRRKNLNRATDYLAPECLSQLKNCLQFRFRNVASAFNTKLSTPHAHKAVNVLKSAGETATRIKSAVGRRDNGAEWASEKRVAEFGEWKITKDAYLGWQAEIGKARESKQHRV